MYIQSPLSNGLYIRPQRPDRRSISYFLKYYALIVWGIISIIVIASLFSTLGYWTFLIIGGYWLYLIAKIWAEKNNRLRESYLHPVAQFARAFFLILCVTFLLAYLYNETAYLDQVDNNTLWLLYIPAINVVSERGSRWALFLVLTIVVVLIYWVTPALGAVFIPFARPFTVEMLLQSVWLIFLSLTSYILLRYMSDALADLNLIINIQNRIREMEGAILRSRVDIDESEYLEKTVEIIKTDLLYEHVNVFRVDKFEKSLLCVAAACEQGKKLVADGFTVAIDDKSIIGLVARSGAAYKANDAVRDDHYLPHKAFPKTRAELAIPIWVRNRLYGVLDIQVHKPHYFLDQDWKAIEILANHVGWVIDNSEQYRHIRWINGIVETIADPIFTQTRLDDTLQKIADSALKELEADLVFLFSYDSSSKDGVMGPIYAGEPYQPEFLQNPSTIKDNVVWRLIEDPGEIYTNEDLSQVNLDDHPLFKPSQIHKVSGKPTFIKRENILAHAIVKLMIKKKCVGVLFMNFRNARTFTAWDKRRYFSFARLAALAIQKMQLQQHLVQTEKNELSRMFHDMLKANAVGLHLILDSIDLSLDDDRKLLEKIEKARGGIRELDRSLHHALRLLKENSYQDLQVELDRMLMDFKYLFKIEFQNKWTGDMQLVSTEQTRELYLVIRQALTNAIDHGKADKIKITGRIKPQSLQATLEDNGVGFIPEQVKTMNGILNMRYRIEELGGVFNLRSRPGRGTKIVVEIPLQKKQEIING